MSSLQNKSSEESELEEIRKGFQMFDTNGTGLVNPLEIKEAMESMKMQEKNPFLFDIISSLSTSEEFQNKEGISIDDLVNFVYEKVSDNESNLGLKQLFDALKDPGSNTISMNTFMKLAKDYDEDDLSREELRYLLEKTQLGGDELTFEEFCTIMKGGGLSSASVRSDDNDYDKNKMISIESNNNNINNISQEIKEEVVNVNKNEDNINNNSNNLNDLNMNESNNDNVNYIIKEENEEIIKESPEKKENEIELVKEEIINDNINNINNNDNNDNFILDNNEDIKQETPKKEIITKPEENKIINEEIIEIKKEPIKVEEKVIEITSPIPSNIEQIKVEEENVNKEEEPKPEENKITIEKKIYIKEKPRKIK